MVLHSGETFDAAVLAAAERDDSYRATVSELLPSWIEQADHSKKLHLDNTADASSSVQLQELTTLANRLATKASVGPTGPSTTLTAQPQVSASFTPNFVNPGNPNSFNVRGEPGSGKTYWVNLVLQIALQYCGPDGCELTDEITSRVTINPGAVTDKISLTQIYSPNSGNLNSLVDYQFKSIHQGTVTGTGLASSSSGSGVWYQGNGMNYRGTVLTVAVALGTEIYEPPYSGSEEWDGAKTHDAHCATTSNVCKYS